MRTAAGAAATCWEPGSSGRSFSWVASHLPILDRRLKSGAIAETAGLGSELVTYEMSIEVLDGEFPAHLWMDAHGDSLVEAALQCGVIEWRWQYFDWGVVLEIDFAEESGWERFRGSTAVQAALDAVPDRFSGLLIYRGRGGSSSPRIPRKPLPRTGAGAVSLEFPDEWVFEPASEPPVLQDLG